MLLAEDFLLDVRHIQTAHLFTLDRVQKCEYPQGRQWYGLVYAVRGKATYRFCAGERLTISQGDVVFLTPQAAYSIVTEKEFEHYTVNFSLHAESSRLDVGQLPYWVLQGGHTDHIKRLFADVTHVWSAKQPGYEMRAIGGLYELLAAVFLGFRQAQKTPSDHRLLLAKGYIEEHFNEPFCLEELAALSNMSVTNFRREWKKRYTEAPLQYRDAIRLYRAKEYLGSGYYTVSEVGEKCGFDDASYFIRFFKKKTGQTPAQYKKEL